ncbi:hypothetical protein CPB86DRAFT_869652 [Serendipita vermifera]|nr:hypothetical protein CPB86DRAFT_869652 [Serendipita vermifera]
MSLRSKYPEPPGQISRGTLISPNIHLISQSCSPSLFSALSLLPFFHHIFICFCIPTSHH